MCLFDILMQLESRVSASFKGPERRVPRNVHVGGPGPPVGDRRAFGLVAEDVAGLGKAGLAMNMLLALVREWKESTNDGDVGEI